MQREIEQAVGYLSRSRRNRIWKRVVGFLACVVIFCTTYALILPAITMEKVPHCGKTEHVHSAACHASGTMKSKKIMVCTTESLGVHKHTDECQNENGNYCCGYSDFLVHEHDASCFDENGNLWCQLPEVKPHIHIESCYEDEKNKQEHVYTDNCYDEEQGSLVCTIPEGEGAHTHSVEDGCYGENGEYICQLEENEGHKHTDECYVENRILNDQFSTESTEESDKPDTICDKEEIILHEHDSHCFDKDGKLICGKCQVLEHVHSQDCFQTVEEPADEDTLICGLEEHTHTLACQSDPTADVETAADWEKTFADVELTGVWEEDVLSIAETQTGYTESTDNFAVDADGVTRKGYTRYGEWYGEPYGDWCAMFVSFCLNYAGIQQEAVPCDNSSAGFMKKMDNAGLYVSADGIPDSGDLIFFDQDGDGAADHMGIIKEVNDREDVQITTIEGDSENCVQSVTRLLQDETILGYGKLPEKDIEIESEVPVMPLNLSHNNDAYNNDSIKKLGLTPGHKKKIDALYDGKDNPDTTLDNSSADLTGLHRLYLDVTPDERPTDLILVLDNSSSMFWNWNDNSWNVEKNDVMNNELEKFIPAFLNSHEGNRINLIYYSGKELNYPVDPRRFPQDQGGNDAVSWDAWNQYFWGTAAQSDNIKACLMQENKNDERGGSEETGRNYAAGLAQAERVLKTANPEHNVELVFLSAGVPSYFIKNDGTRGGNGLAIEEQAYDSWRQLAKTNEARCKEATLETIRDFKSRYPDLVMSAVGFGRGITSGGIAEEVLKTIPQNGGSYYHENQREGLSGNLTDILRIKLTNTTISDTLSEYVEIHPVQPDYKVTMNDGKTQTVLYENGKKTRAGSNILQSVGYDEDARSVSATFNPDYVLKSGVTYTLSYNIQAAQKAYTEFEESGYTQTGDRDTDYEDNQTSAGKKGFYANEAATLSYAIGEKTYDEDYAHPVIQVDDNHSGDLPEPEEGITLPHNKKIDAFRDGMDNPDTTLDNRVSDKTDLYRLYLDVLPLEQGKPTDLLLVLDNSGSMFKTEDIDGKTRNEAMKDVLDTFIPQFLESHSENRISIVYFSGPRDYYDYNKVLTDNLKESKMGDAWVAYQWGSDPEQAKTALVEECENSSDNYAGTNYVAGLQTAETVLQQAKPGHDVKMIFLSDGIPTHYTNKDGSRGGNGLSVEGQDDWYWWNEGDKNEKRCRQPTIEAVNEFKINHPDLQMSAIAYSGTAEGTSSYALQMIPQNGGTLSYVKESKELLDAFTGRRVITGLTFSDTLSQYVDLYTNQPDYKVVMRKNGESDIVLYEHGRVTADGMDKLTGVKFDPESKTVTAVFKENYELDTQWKYELSFNVQTTQAAYNEYSVSGYPHTGDKETDYGENETSSKQPGFHSNDNAKVDYVFDGKSHSDLYEHPVVQTAVCKLVIRKTDSENKNKILSGAQFTLYRKAGVSEQHGITLDGLDGTYVKVMENLISDERGQILIDNLVPGDYGIVETRAPDHYEKLNSPIPVTLTRGTDGSSHIQGSDETIEIGGEILPLLNISNMLSMYELPATGGTGTTPYTIGGLLLAAAALLLLYKNKQRGKEDIASS